MNVKFRIGTCACKSIAWFCSVQYELNHTVEMVLVDLCDRNYKHLQNKKLPASLALGLK